MSCPLPKRFLCHAGTIEAKKPFLVGSSGRASARDLAVIGTLLSSVPGRFSAELGLSLSTKRRRDIFLWFLAALLYGTRIPGSIVARTHTEFVRRGLSNPEQIVKTGWDGLVAALDAGGYVRYDFKTATKLMNVMKQLIDQYGGDLDGLHEAARDAGDLETRLKALGKGIGDVTVQIFLRELRGVWSKAHPPLSALGLQAAMDLALLPTTWRATSSSAVDRLIFLWRRAGVRGKSFSDFESALVRLGRDYCRRQRKQDCPMREFCTRQRMGAFQRGSGLHKRVSKAQP